MIRILEHAGFSVVSTRGSHCKLRHQDRTVIVPLGRDITPDRLQDLL
jgi:predicted RNA binding protein YcfA (HicA-like mRNA interferase family)